MKVSFNGPHTEEWGVVKVKVREEAADSGKPYTSKRYQPAG